MARTIGLDDLLRFQDHDSEKIAEQTDEKQGRIEKMVQPDRRDLSPFQRVKFGARDCFLAAGAVPIPDAVN